MSTDPRNGKSAPLFISHFDAQCSPATTTSSVPKKTIQRALPRADLVRSSQAMPAETEEVRKIVFWTDFDGSMFHISMIGLCVSLLLLPSTALLYASNPCKTISAITHNILLSDAFKRKSFIKLMRPNASRFINMAHKSPSGNVGRHLKQQRRIP